MALYSHIQVVWYGVWWMSGRCYPTYGVNDVLIPRKPRTCLLSRFRMFELYFIPYRWEFVLSQFVKVSCLRAVSPFIPHHCE